MKKSLLAAVFFITAFASAQKMELKSGDLAVLKNEKEVNVEFNFSNVKLMKENKSEAEYVADRQAELNGKAKGNGDIWKKKWEAAPEGIWKPKFLELINTVLTKEDKNVTFQEGLSSAKYTLIVDIDWIFPGWDVYMMKQPAKVTTTLKVVESANKSKVLAEVTSENAPGDQWGNNFSNESRIGEGFAKTGKSFAKLLLKKAYK